MRYRGPRAAAAAVLACLVVPAACAAATAAPRAFRPPPDRVTLLSDSVAGIVPFTLTSHPELAAGIALFNLTATCRRLLVDGCTDEAFTPPGALETIRDEAPLLGRTVVVSVGYNDPADGYAEGIDEVMQALVAAGVEHVIWVTLAGLQQSWIEIDEAIRAAPARWPQLVVADWDAYSAGRPWFSDGPHLNAAGGFALTKLLRGYELAACGSACAPPRLVTRSLPVARAGARYAARLVATAGTPPYTWAVRGLPVGLRLEPDGSIAGTPRHPGRARIRVVVHDEQCTGTETLTLVVAP